MQLKFGIMELNDEGIQLLHTKLGIYFSSV